MKQTIAIAKKELNAYFGSPMALIFIGVFLAATLFSFFWIDAFFSRGVADVRPLFRWMPLLLIFLVAALTMRQWSHEAQSGTLEMLLTLPVHHWQLVLGKFLAVMGLVALSLALTLFVPITVSIIGNLDWGPVIGGYLAALLMASSYAAIGLFISSRTDNDIVALILTVLAGAILYLIGTSGVTEFAGETLGGVLRSLATGSRFESIERGVIDLRDLVYYLSLTLAFLAFNALSLQSKSWSDSPRTAAQRRNAVLATSLIALNLLALNIWLSPHTRARLDLTADRQYTLSRVTVDMISDLQEPLLLRAYLSERTHPLLSPLAPRITDMLREYEAASGGAVTVEIVDPAQEPELEAEAYQTYGIRPTPFQVAGRYEAAVINAYFDILVRYGDQSEVLNFRDLIEVETFRDGEVDVRLRNLEYDLTRAIKKTVYGFQDTASIVASLPEPAQLTLFVTPNTLPADLAETPQTIQNVADAIQADAGDKFSFTIVDLDDPNAQIDRQTLLDEYGIQPFAASLFALDTYYLHMLLQVGDEAQVIYPSGGLTEADFRASIESALKRFSTGFLQVVGVWQPVIEPDPIMAQMGQTQQQPFSTWNTLLDSLREEYEVRSVNLTSGQVPADLDVLLVIAPQNMTDVERYAIDQFLMRGGALIVAGSNYRISADTFTGELTASPIDGGLRDMLAHYGVDVEQTLVLDAQNEPFPIVLTRDIGGISMQEVQAINYPYFVDVRADGMAQDSPMIASLPAVTLNWASPVRIDEEKTADMDVATLLTSSPNAWLSDDTNIQPNMELYPEMGFATGEEKQSYPLAVSLIGSFDSYFAGKEIPAAGEEAAAAAPIAAGTVEESPGTARLVVIGSGDFLNDTVFSISSQISYDGYLNSLRFIQNAVDWSVEDLDLLAIRSRGTYARLLDPLEPSEQSYWEILNYAVALIALIAIGFYWASRRRSQKPMTLRDNRVSTLEQEVSLERS